MKRATAVIIAFGPMLALSLGACAVGGVGDLDDESDPSPSATTSDEPAPPPPDDEGEQESSDEEDDNQGPATPPPDDEPPPPPPEEPAPDTDTVCYPGEDKTYSACLPLVPFDGTFGNAYQYPSHGDPAYAAPQRFIDLSQADPNLMLSPNFALVELMQEWKGNWGVYQLHMVEVLQAIREDSGGALMITSGYRNPAYNGSVGGATYSRHMYGDAADMHSGVLSLSQLAQQCHGYGADYVDIYTSHVHCDWRNTPGDDAFYGPAPQADQGQGQSAQQHDASLLLEGDIWYAPADGFDEGEPLRQWSAFDADGALLELAEGADYQPPADAATVEVAIGGRLSLRAPRAAPLQVERLGYRSHWR